MQSWEDYKKRKDFKGWYPQAAGDEGAALPMPKPAHPEIKGQFKGPPPNFRSAGRDQPVKQRLHPGVAAALDKSFKFACELLDTLETLPPPLCDRFYGYTEWLGDLRADLSEALKGKPFAP